MTNNIENKTFQIVKKGRKYFEALLNGKYKCQIVINDVVSTLEENSTVRLSVENNSVPKAFGQKLVFTPVSILVTGSAEVVAKATEKAEEVRKFIAFAKKDIQNGMSFSTAYYKVFELENRLNTAEFASQIEDLKRKNAEVHAKILAAKAAREAAAKAERAEIAAKRAAAPAKPREAKNRVLFPISKLPRIGEKTIIGGSEYVFTGFGKTFYISDDHPSYEGSHLLGYEGDRGCYAYY